ncbi:MBL fold metallo-hydrolase [candidate division KSB3 bacterium]|uniref:MBL fold metallo-hydrolase n=1 Tax=candidate division KSB3 bacterium TaxID=2044937 RepID=A0A2G6E6Z2_9BACT|nr:MAG: MBL fold metallo-hydrolase [candidate division KSB3 bacterium]PIE30290.1 MAG: MBL fold metallo-hydrolase [candidate division KSB3 bacterium]
MKAVEIKKDIYWVGGIDWNLRNFHGYLTQRGSTYNAYLIVDEKITLVDSVKYYLCDELLKRISDVVDPSKIDYIVSNHVEMDHSGSLPMVKEIAKDATVITSPKGRDGLTAHYKQDLGFKVVKTGDTLNLGKRSLSFVQTPMVHWPDNMVTYIPEEKILLSNDSFGQHIASSERFDDEYPLHIVLEEARKYYANIVMPFGPQVQRALKALSGLEIETICPSHGIVWRSHISTVLEQYAKWSANDTDEKAVIIYDTMWGSTEKIAYSIQQAFEEKRIHTSMFNLQYNHISDIMTEVMTAKYICVGSPTLNNNMLPTVGAFLTYFKGLAPKNRIGLAFGSYGWSGQSVGLVEDVLKDCGFNMMKNIRLQYIPDEATLQSITEAFKGELT